MTGLRFIYTMKYEVMCAFYHLLRYVKKYHKPSNQLHKETAVKPCTRITRLILYLPEIQWIQNTLRETNEDLSDSSLSSVLARNRLDWVTEREERPTLTVNIANIALRALRALQIKIDQTQSIQPSSLSPHLLLLPTPSPLPPPHWPKTLTKTLCVRAQ